MHDIGVCKCHYSIVAVLVSLVVLERAHDRKPRSSSALLSLLPMKTTCVRLVVVVAMVVMVVEEVVVMTVVMGVMEVLMT